MQILQAQSRPQPFEIELDRTAREAYLDGIPMELGDREYALLCRFVAYTRKKTNPRNSDLSEMMRNYHVAD